jgi:hypothetical protein
MAVAGAKLSEAERLRRDRRKGSYHLVAARSQLEIPTDNDDDEEEEDNLYTYLIGEKPQGSQLELIRYNAKVKLFKDLSDTGGRRVESHLPRSFGQSYHNVRQG